MSPALTSVLPCGVAICASPWRTITTVSSSGRTVLGHAEGGNALGQLNLNISFCEVRKVGLGVRAEAKNVGKVELQFRARVVARGNLVAGHGRLIQPKRRPVAGITPLRGYVAVNQADPRHALVRLRWSFARRSAGLRFGG